MEKIIKSKLRENISKTLHVNLHVHSAYSDGQFTPESLAAQAVENNVAVLGISDHFFTRKTGSIFPDILPRYIDELDRVAALFKDDLILLKAIEINTLEFFLTGQNLPPMSNLERLDYVLLENISNIPRAGVPLRHAIQLSQDIPIPVGLAHTDLPMAFPGISPSDLISRLDSAEIFIELNEAYRRPGERKPFYRHYGSYLEAAWSSGLTFSAGSDVHSQITGGALQAMSFLADFGLDDRLFIYPL